MNNDNKTTKSQDPNSVERLHDLGMMPDWAYYQQNGKSAMENYIAQKEEIRQRYVDQEDEPMILVSSEVKVEK